MYSREYLVDILEHLVKTTVIAALLSHQHHQKTQIVQSKQDAEEINVAINERLRHASRQGTVLLLAHHGGTRGGPCLSCPRQEKI